MKVAGFTIIKNAMKHDFPVVEAILSILPICDEFVVAVGDSEDDTLQLIQAIHSKKIKIIKTTWDDSLQGKGGILYAHETNKAFKEISPEMDWAFYIQSDEVVHEKYLPHIKSQMQKYKNDPKVDGLLFHYKHFWGNYQYYGASYKWYRKEIRIIKNQPQHIYSYKDAQSFRKDHNKKLKVHLLDAEIYHYGYVRSPDKFAKKRTFQHNVYNEEKIQESCFFDYEKEVDYLLQFKETHPAVMKNRIAKKDWDFTHDFSKNKYRTLKDKFKFFVEKWTGYVVGEFKNYILLKK